MVLEHSVEENPTPQQSKKKAQEEQQASKINQYICITCIEDIEEQLQPQRGDEEQTTAAPIDQGALVVKKKTTTLKTTSIPPVTAAPIQQAEMLSALVAALVEGQKSSYKRTGYSFYDDNGYNWYKKVLRVKEDMRKANCPY